VIRGGKLKVLIYTGSLQYVNKSGVGEAVRHQIKTLERLGIDYTTQTSDDYDIIHLNTIFPDSLIMSKQAKHEGKKVIYYAHSTMEDFRNSFRGSNLFAPLFKRWITHCYNSGDLIITPTKYSKQLLEGYDLKRPIFNISNGIDTEFFIRNPDARNRFREKYHIGKDEKVIISVGHYIERKGILDFVKLAEQLPEYQFYWFGYTSLRLVPHDIQKALKSKLLNLHFPGYVSRDELRDAYSGSDLFLFLTYEETEGIVLLEALSSRIPTLIRDIPIYKQWLVNGKNVYKGRNNSEFKEKIIKILDNKLPNITESGYNLALERDLKIVGQRLLDVYKL